MGETVSTPQFDELRKSVRELMARRKWPIKQSASLAGVAESTFHMFLSDKYTGNNANVAETLKKWLAAETEREKRPAVAQLGFVATPTATAFMDVLQHAQTVPDLVVVMGAPGVGKTTAARAYRDRSPNVWMVTARPSCASTHAMLEQICTELNVQEASPTKRNAAIVRRVRGTRGLLIIDEAQHLTPEALDELRSLHDLGEVGLALLGNESVYARLSGGGKRAEFAQMHSRVGMKLHRRKPLAGDIDMLLDASGVQGDAQRKLLKAEAGKPGALRGVAKAWRLAQMAALGDGADAVEDEHVQRAIAQLSDNAEAA